MSEHRGQVSQPEMADLHQGPIPIPASPWGLQPPPQTQPLQPHPFLSPSCPPAWIFPKQSATEHTMHKLHSTPTLSEENSSSCAVSVGPQARGKKTASQQAHCHNGRPGCTQAALHTSSPSQGGLQGAPPTSPCHRPTRDRCLGALQLGFLCCYSRSFSNAYLPHPPSARLSRPILSFLPCPDRHHPYPP